jgi:2',3'-cyclic-nucleotide 2'-phosphodiesterase (5'-nucleotidase family)
VNAATLYRVLIAVTDDNLRTRSTDFGNFAADALKRGAQADIALINAGSFRFDVVRPPG